MTIKQIKQWFETAVPNPDEKTLRVQMERRPDPRSPGAAMNKGEQ